MKATWLLALGRLPRRPALIKRPGREWPASHATARLAAIGLLLVFVLSADARVFRRWSAHTRGDRVLLSAGGWAAYEAKVTLNGGQGRLAVFGFDRPIGEVARALGRAFDTRSLAPGAGGSMSIGVVRASGRVLRLVLVEPDAGKGTVVFQFDQSATEAARSRTPPRDPIHDLPSYPDAETQFYVRDEAARADFAVFLSDAQLSDVAGFYARQLESEGWRQPLPLPPAAAARPRMLVFERGPSVCCVYIAHSGISGRTQIALLRKTIGPNSTTAPRASVGECAPGRPAGGVAGIRKQRKNAGADRSAIRQPGLFLVSNILTAGGVWPYS